MRYTFPTVTAAIGFEDLMAGLHPYRWTHRDGRTVSLPPGDDPEEVEHTALDYGGEPAEEED